MTDPNRRIRGILFNTITAITVVSIAAFLVWSLRPLILPIILGVLFAYLFKPLKTAFKYRWLPNGIRVVLVFSILTGGILMSVKFVKDNIPNDKEKLEIIVRMKYKFNEKFEKMMNIDPATGQGNALYNLISRDINPLRVGLNKYLELTPEQIEDFLDYYNGVDGYEPVPEKYYQYFRSNNKHREKLVEPRTTASKPSKSNDKSTSSDQSFLLTIVNILSIWFVLPIVFVVFLLDDGAIQQFFIKLVPNRYFELALTVREEVDYAIGKYLRGISLECGLVAASMALGLVIVGIPIKMALLISLLAGIATAIPLLGPVVGLSFALTYALIAEDISPILPMVDMDNLPLAVFVVIGIVLVLDNIVFQPIVLGGAVNLHPLVVILGIMAASMLFGMTGVLLAIPTIVVLKAIIQHTFRGLKDYRII
ncbi:MAG: AI-2E family transporter [Oligoflexia bacterium]|nr:AI-2E family transporter [Oligoflexia bacterium]